MNERRIHQLFEISVLLKGAHALIECLGGIVLALVSTESILRLANRIAQPELLNDSHDFIATHLLGWAQDFSVGTKNFYAYYLLSHGLVKVLLVIGLLRGKMWAYPASLAALGLFIVYQLYRFTDTHGIGLIILTIFDLLVMVLIWQEYKVVRHHVPTRKTSGGGEE
ncbi:DUF2127 domain-containing protein [Rhizobium sp. No.120]